MKRTTIFAAILILLSLGCSMTSCTEKPQPENSQAMTAATADPQSPPGTETAAAELNGEPPQFSAAGGFYDDSFSLTLSAAGGAAIYYTLDGSAPTTESLRYSGPIPITDRSDEPNTISMHTGIVPDEAPLPASAPKSPVDKATVVRAMAIGTDGSRSPAVSQTYFVGFDEKASYYQDWKIISLMTDESNLFDDAKGIYVLGKTHSDWKNGDEFDASVPDYFMPANYRQSGRDWERPASLEVFANGKQIASQDIGIRIHGGATRSYPQKSLNLYARSEYGASKLNCDLFSGAVCSEETGEPITEFDTVMLRNGGNDAMYTRFRDKLNQRLSAGRAFLTQGMEPCIVFLNGEYWGHYEITEKPDDDFIQAHCGIPKKQVCIIKKDALDEGSEETFAEWQQLRKWINETDFSDAAAYEQLCTKIDMQSFMDYISCEIYFANVDWHYANTAMWKSEMQDAANPYADGKWRFLMFDTDYSTGIYEEALPTYDSFARVFSKDCFLGDLLHGALENADFRQQFADTFTEIADNNFNTERVDKEIDAMEALFHDAAIDTLGRFWNTVFGGKSGEYAYQESVKAVREFYQKRREPVMQLLAEYAGTDTDSASDSE